MCTLNRSANYDFVNDKGTTPCNVNFIVFIVVIDETTNQSTHHYKASPPKPVIPTNTTNTPSNTQKLSTVDADNQSVRQPRVSFEMMMLPQMKTLMNYYYFCFVVSVALLFVVLLLIFSLSLSYYYTITKMSESL